MPPYSLDDKLVIGISSRALFDLEVENEIFEQQQEEAYARYQRERENEPLRPGTAFPLIKALLNLNNLIADRRLVEVVVMSKNSPDTGLRAFNSVEHYGLDISRAAFTRGESLAPYLDAFEVDLFLSKHDGDVQAAIDNGVAAAVLYEPPEEIAEDAREIRIAFDGDAVLFSDESERIYKEQGLEAFLEHERQHRGTSLPEGPFAKLLRTLSVVQQQFAPRECPLKIALVTARCSPTHTRVIHTLRDWGVTIDEAFFLGGVSKEKVLKSFGAQIFFDDQDTHLAPASRHVPSGRVPYRGGAIRQKKKTD
ncbi:MAG: 5'-nucleotidase [Desulfuromonadales bacterium]|nr:5'-nucleotidase [Desulfuromonadales bacterium]NIR33077.1 5'-nucleotidase [Desulfuromonadales bacterium]NIS39315.1 5'-nucleotidase [Desulfuromonadales bacterium]